MQSWLVMGPLQVQGDQKAHRAAFDTNHLNPAHFEPTLNIDGKQYQWRLLTNETGTIDLTRPFQNIMGILYAWAQIEMPEETTAVLGIGSDDAVKDLA